MRTMIAMLMLLTAPQLWAQEPGSSEKRRKNPRRSTGVSNPFDAPAPRIGAGMEDDYGEDDMQMGMGDMDMMNGDGTGMMDMIGMGEPIPDPEAKFRRGLQRAIAMLKNSKDESSKEIVRGHIRAAFDQRYDRMIAQRKKDVERLRESITKLESDLQRRTAAKKRVVELQLQSVQLAAEGLLEISDPQPAMGGGMDEMEGDGRSGMSGMMGSGGGPGFGGDEFRPAANEGGIF